MPSSWLREPVEAIFNLGRSDGCRITVSVSTLVTSKGPWQVDRRSPGGPGKDQELMYSDL